MAEKRIKIQWVHSATGRSRRQKETVRGLGFTKLNQVRDVVDTAATRGMVNKISHLVRIVQ